MFFGCSSSAVDKILMRSLSILAPSGLFKPQITEDFDSGILLIYLVELKQKAFSVSLRDSITDELLLSSAKSRQQLLTSCPLKPQKKMKRKHKELL